MKKFKTKNLLISELLAVAMILSVMLGFGLGETQVQTVHATGGEPNRAVKISEIDIGGVTPNVTQGVTFANGVLTIDSNCTVGLTDNPALLIRVNITNGDKADLKVVISGERRYIEVANEHGNLTIECNATVHAQEIYAAENLTLNGEGIFDIHPSSDGYFLASSVTRYSVVYAGEKLSIEGNVVVQGNTNSANNVKSVLCAKSIEINTTSTVEPFAALNTNGWYCAPIVFHSCGNANDLAGRLVIKQGALCLGKYYNTEDTQYNDKCGFVGYSNAAVSNHQTGNIYSSSYFDTNNKAFTGYEIAESNSKLVVKTRSVLFEQNGGTGDFFGYGHLLLNEEVTLPECPYTAPEGKHFAGWALGSKTATSLKQPGDTFVIEDNGYDYISENYYGNYYKVYAIWEDNAPVVNYINEIRITSTTTSVVEGALPSFTATTSTEHAEIAKNGNTTWLYWNENENQWYGFGAGEKVAVADGTHYCLRLCCYLDSGYEFGDNVTIYFNDVDWTSVGHTKVQKISAWGGFVHIDLGEAEAPEVNYITEIRISCEILNAYVGAAPYIDAELSAEHATLDNSNSIWVYWKTDENRWQAINSNPIAEGNRYGLSFRIIPEEGYEFAENITIYYNDTDVTDKDYTRVIPYYNYYWVNVDLGETVPVHAVTYHANGGVGEDFVVTVVNEQHEFVDFLDTGFTPLEGWEFAYWSHTADGSERVYGNSMEVKQDKDLYAIWEKIEYTSFTVSFDNNGGSNTMSPDTNVKRLYELPNCTFMAPTGKQFKCWAEGSPEGTQYNAGEIYTVSGDVTFYAVWEDCAVIVEPQVEPKPEVIETEPEKGGLGTGAVIAIVAVSLAVLGGGGFCVYYFVIRKKKLSSTTTEKTDTEKTDTEKTDTEKTE